jgi:hypothetical protein
VHRVQEVLAPRLFHHVRPGTQDPHPPCATGDALDEPPVRKFAVDLLLAPAAALDDRFQHDGYQEDTDHRGTQVDQDVPSDAADRDGRGGQRRAVGSAVQSFVDEALIAGGVHRTTPERTQLMTMRTLLCATS